MKKAVAHISPYGVACGVAKHLSYWLPFGDTGGWQHFIMAESAPAWCRRVPMPPAAYSHSWRRGALDGFSALKTDLLHLPCPTRVVHIQYDPGFFNSKQWDDIGEWCSERRIPIVTTAHCLLDSALWTWTNKAMLRNSAAVVAGTPLLVEALNAYADRFHLPVKRKARYIPLAMPSTVGLPPVSRNGPSVLTWGFLGGMKGHRMVYEAVRLLRERGHDRLKYVVMGAGMTGEQQNTLKELQAMEARDPDGLEVREGFFDDAEILTACRKASVVALNHLWQVQSSSGTVAVSVASGAPVVVSPSPMFNGYIESGACAVGGETPEAWADTLERHLDGISQKEEEGQELMRSLASPTRVASEYLKLYSEVVGT